MNWEKKKMNLLEMPIWKALITLAIPIILANLLQIAYWLIDSFWIWRYSETSFAAMTLAGNATFLIISFGIWFAIAWSILVAQYFWAENKKKVNKVAAQSMTTMILGWLSLSVILYFLAPYILHWMWAEQELYDEALSYIKISFIALTFNFAFFMFQSIVRWIWEVKIPIYITLLCVTLNFIFDPLFIFWYSIFPELWVRWAALMTLLTQAIATALWFYVLFKWKSWIKTKLEDYIPDKKLISENFKLWLPSSIEAVTRSLTFTLMTSIVAHIWAWLFIQSTLLSAYGAGGSVIQVTILISIAITQATAVLVWQHAWAWNKEKAREVIKTVSKLSFSLMTFLWIIIFIFSPSLINIFIPGNQEVNYYWTQMVRIASLFLWLTWVTMALSWVLRATWHTKAPMYATIIWNFFIKIPFAYFFSKYTILGLNLWVKWIWWSEVVSVIVLLSLMVYFVWKINWNHINLVKEPNIID